MKFSLSSITYFFLLLSITTSVSVNATDEKPYYNVSNQIPAVFVFGDSIVDTGNNNWFVTIGRSDFPQYGKNFEGGKATGRFCDGKVPSDIFVEQLGIKKLLPPYLDPTLQPKDLITGVNFASAGSGYNPQTNPIAAISIQKQLELFEEYIGKLEKIVGEEGAAEIVRKSLVIVSTGGNDIHLINPSALNPSSTQIMLNFATTFLQGLYKLGARRIGVFGVGPLGCVPFYRNTAGGLERKCVDFLNEKAKLFNSKLTTEIDSLMNNFPDGRIVYIDLYNFLLDLINNPFKYGYIITKNGCCSLAGSVELMLLCPKACSNDYDYVFWDSFHHTEKGYRLLVNQVLQQHLQTFLS